MDVLKGAIALALAWLAAACAPQADHPESYALAARFGGPGEAPGEFRRPIGIAYDGGVLYVADSLNHRIESFDAHGRFLRVFGANVLQRPMNLDARGGKVYVADYFADAVFVFADDGRLQARLAPPGGLHSPGGVSVRRDGKVLVADTYAQRVVELAPGGALLRGWGAKGRKGIGKARFNYPTGVAAAPDGGFYVADGYNDRIQQFDAGGAFVRRWGGPFGFGLNVPGHWRGWFAVVTGVAVDAAGNVYAADFYNDRVQKFTSDGRALAAFGQPWAGPGHTLIGVAAAPDGGTVYATDFSRNEVQVWRRQNP